MKKILLFILLSVFTFGQEISPYHPAKQDNAWRGYEPTQLTFYDAMFVAGALQNFVTDRMAMVVTGSDASTYHFQDKFSTGKLNIALKQEKIKSNVAVPEIVISIKISGDKDKVYTFFVEYWGTTIDWGAKKADVERTHMQDVIRLHFNGGKPYITITNGTYKSTSDFENFFNTLLEKP
ncbi:hypothetical protein [Chryseobacterium herbae]|uniref:DUF4468 domain-containing protein n=1 Tax=Chryseobacterium herbae TaxID=2976476 RepID=A0ABT2J079_9FLAO|nr:hypothetical protein [Chryseobacterium sp. pc1-10]MCT2563965.1 hypothetical protein [Chryseobacterium sp. pc1-10]